MPPVIKWATLCEPEITPGWKAHSLSWKDDGRDGGLGQERVASHGPLKEKVEGK